MAPQVASFAPIRHKRGRERAVLAAHLASDAVCVAKRRMRSRVGLMQTFLRVDFFKQKTAYEIYLV